MAAELKNDFTVCKDVGMEDQQKFRGCLQLQTILTVFVWCRWFCFVSMHRLSLNL